MKHSEQSMTLKKHAAIRNKHSETFAVDDIEYIQEKTYIKVLNRVANIMI